MDHVNALVRVVLKSLGFFYTEYEYQYIRIIQGNTIENNQNTFKSSVYPCYIVSQFLPQIY